MNLSEFKNEIRIIFEKVRNDVRGISGQHRAGLRLGLAELGMNRGGFIGGTYFHPGIDIIMNTSPLRKILESQQYEIVWAYTYHVLLGLYLKSIGIIDEHQCKVMTLKVSKEIFKDANHPTVIMAVNGVGSFIQNLKITYIPPDRRPDGMPLPIEYITGFDEESQTYFS